MKKVILGLSALCMIAFTSCKDDAASKVNSDNVALAAERDANAGNLPMIKFDKETHDFGTIENGTPVETVFKYTNTGNSMLVVSNVKSTCGCTVPSYPKEPIMPGESGYIKVKYDTKRVGPFTKYVTLTTNATSNTSTRLKITGTVEAEAAPIPVKEKSLFD
mgnify:CR=1 FL=1